MRKLLQVCVSICPMTIFNFGITIIFVEIVYNNEVIWIHATFFFSPDLKSCTSSNFLKSVFRVDDVFRMIIYSNTYWYKVILKQTWKIQKNIPKLSPTEPIKSCKVNKGTSSWILTSNFHHQVDKRPSLSGQISIITEKVDTGQASIIK